MIYNNGNPQDINTHSNAAFFFKFILTFYFEQSIPTENVKASAVLLDFFTKIQTFVLIKIIVLI